MVNSGRQDSHFRHNSPAGTERILGMRLGLARVRYTLTAAALHWIGATPLFAAIRLGRLAAKLRRSPDKLELFAFDTGFGVSLFLPAFLRNAGRLARRPPGRDGAGLPWHDRVAATIRWSLRALMPTRPRSRAFVARPMKTGVCLVGVLVQVFVATTTQSAHARTIAIQAERRDDTINIYASAQVQARVETAWRVLTAYERFPEFIPDLRSSRVIARRGSTVTVEQTGNARVWLLSLPIEVTFEIQEFPPSGMRSRAVAGTFHSMESCYAVMPNPSGIRLDYVGHIATGFGAFGTIELQAVRENISRQFRALAEEIERQGATDKR